jgi:hypothetical protein
VAFISEESSDWDSTLEMSLVRSEGLRFCDEAKEEVIFIQLVDSDDL